MNRWFISVEELVEQRKDKNIVVVDCRFTLSTSDEGENLHAKSHIPGAHYLHLNRDLSGPASEHGGRHPLPDPAVLKAKLESIGISSDTLVVAYDDHRLAFASRLWWLLRYLGHDNVKVLDGGFNAWRQAGLDISAEPAVTARAGGMRDCIRPELVVDIGIVKTIINKEQTLLVDSRENERFLGLKEPVDPVAGHIDGAVNCPWQEVTDDAGFFMNEQHQKQRWQNKLNTPEIVVYCGSGVTACVNLLSLAELGRDDAKLYVGSWSDWCSYL